MANLDDIPILVKVARYRSTLQTRQRSGSTQKATEELLRIDSFEFSQK